MPGSGRESWTLLGDGGEVVEPAERYLAYLRSAAVKNVFERYGFTTLAKPTS